MTRSRTTRTALAAVTTAALALGLGACASDEDAGTPKASATDDKKISIGVHAGWDEGIAVSHLFKAMLEDDGYTVDAETADPGVVYTGSRAAATTSTSTCGCPRPTRTTSRSTATTSNSPASGTTTRD